MVTIGLPVPGRSAVEVDESVLLLVVVLLVVGSLVELVLELELERWAAGGGGAWLVVVPPPHAAGIRASDSSADSTSARRPRVDLVGNM
jgi:hypothetical protein